MSLKIRDALEKKRNDEVTIELFKDYMSKFFKNKSYIISTSKTGTSSCRFIPFMEIYNDFWIIDYDEFVLSFHYELHWQVTKEKMLLYCDLHEIKNDNILNNENYLSLRKLYANFIKKHDNNNFWKRAGRISKYHLLFHNINLDMDESHFNEYIIQSELEKYIKITNIFIERPYF